MTKRPSRPRTSTQRSPLTAEPGRPRRCAVYTRVSTENGLDQEFNSLDAQREACEAYVRSQLHEGWTLLPGCYADGGYSGGSLERPDLKRLMADITARRLDVVVVYKVDRLTRSLADFATLVALFDAHGVSFVSVTQSFNTTTSMGRLTLNVLLSFAQFEREVTAERIRDKVAASRRKGLRTGGPTPLGYRLSDKKLIPDEREAADVRAIFEGYLAEESLTALIAHLNAKGIKTKRTLRRDGTQRGGCRFSKGALAHVLKNRIYIGEVTHKGRSYPGEHLAILERELFDRVQAKLQADTGREKRRRTELADAFLLAGRIFDDQGNRMTPVTARKRGAHYRYYVSHALMQGRKDEAGSVKRAAALDIERAVLETLLAQAGIITGDEEHKPASAPEPNTNGSVEAGAPDLLASVKRVSVARNHLLVQLAAGDVATDRALTIPYRPRTNRARRTIVLPDSLQAPTSAAARERFLRAVAQGRAWVEDLVTGRCTTTREIARRERCSERHVRMMIDKAFIAPRTTRVAAVQGPMARNKFCSHDGF